ncbi:hypothetical protein ABZ330_12585 [Streptomyces sp. NPDC006172]|uniref:hypothetical protein n=1 Tax=Streptomyces sp. NPDC006172 TaxID=3154470 RepID=UPI00340DFC0D
MSDVVRQGRVLAAVQRTGRGRGHRRGVGGGHLSAACLAPAQPPVAGEGRGDLLGAQPDGIVDGQGPQPAHDLVEGGKLRLGDLRAHPPRPPLPRPTVVPTGFEPA